jgi:indolepyruvate ferredoxin oxidoreductase, alpha subunit
MEMIENNGGVQVLILRQICALSPEKKHKKRFDVSVDTDKCLGERCGCNRLCTRIFRCPGLIWDTETGTARIDEAICTGCGVCVSICPQGAIMKREAR